jgi:hypothetical protein
MQNYLSLPVFKKPNPKGILFKWAKFPVFFLVSPNARFFSFLNSNAGSGTIY